MAHFAYTDSRFLIWIHCRCRNMLHECMKACHSPSVNATVENALNISSKKLTSCLFVIQHDIFMTSIP